jgi:4-hydroxy-tetrahydrodipicolinate synthase
MSPVKTKKSKIAKEKYLPRRADGVVTALTTPFIKGEVDYKSLEKLVKFQLDKGVQGFVVNGTTGESPTLEWGEVKKIYDFVKKTTDNSVPLILGVGDFNTKVAIEKTKYVEAWGADAGLSVVPYYNKPPQRCLIQHFEAIAQSTTAPIILYNVPGRTVVSLSDESVGKLAAQKNIVGIKEASGEIDLAKRIRNKTSDTFLITSGDDASCINFLLAGGDGVISVLSHVIPERLRSLVDRARRGDKSVKDDYIKYERLNRLLGIEANPIPVKMMLKLMGIFQSAELRMPLSQMEAANTEKLQEELSNLDIIK